MGFIGPDTMVSMLSHPGKEIQKVDSVHLNVMISVWETFLDSSSLVTWDWSYTRMPTHAFYHCGQTESSCSSEDGTQDVCWSWQITSYMLGFETPHFAMLA